MKKFFVSMAIVAAIMFSASLVTSADPPGKAGVTPAKKGKSAMRFDHKDNTVKSKACEECHPKDKKSGKVKTEMPASKPK